MIYYFEVKKDTDEKEFWNGNFDIGCRNNDLTEKPGIDCFTIQTDGSSEVESFFSPLFEKLP